ncbi:MAG: aldo/keto reductase [Dysgonamonadaceae bacterium]|jgi:L-glyceraldehyde 3-phosphate reductase|nr:aldo/keto reductase [Dysgonamonadaceae bacterium]
MDYRFCGYSGLQLPALSLGLWHNFGDVDDFSIATNMVLHAFEQGITHFDLANNYGPSPGSAESNFGKILKTHLQAHRDEMIVSSKAGYEMWAGPYGIGGSRKYLMASLHQSLKRTGLDYFDIFYSHRYDPQTPIEETMQALTDMVKQGKALYAGISNYPADKAKQAYDLLKSQNTPCLIYQGKYSLLHRVHEAGVLPLNEAEGVGYIAFSPLAQGLLTNKYLNGIPEQSRAAKAHGHLQSSAITPELISKIKQLNELASQRGQTLAGMSLAWLLQNKRVTSVIIGTSSVAQMDDNLQALQNTHFDDEELQKIEEILA